MIKKILLCLAIFLYSLPIGAKCWRLSNFKGLTLYDPGRPTLLHSQLGGQYLDICIHEGKATITGPLLTKEIIKALPVKADQFLITGPGGQSLFLITDEIQEIKDDQSRCDCGK